MLQKRRRTKIVCTIGPACENEETIYQMILAGMDVARFNFSHGTREEHGMRMQLVRRVASRVGKRIGLMLDTRGPEIRLGKFEGGKVLLKPNQRFVLTTEEVLGNHETAYVSLPDLPSVVEKGAIVLLDDGNVQLEVVEVSGKEVVTRVLNEGVVSDRKKVSLPGRKLSLPAVDGEDRKDLLFGASQGIDFVAASFVRSASDIFEVRKVLEEGGSKARIIAKIECMQGVTALEEILEAADGIMVARGDLGVELAPEEIPILQKRMIVEANKLGKPVITATQMLESMVTHPRPTRAEASDVANAIFDGTDAVMLSAETASGQYPVEAVKFMASIAVKAEEALHHQEFLTRYRQGFVPNITEAVSRSVVISATDLGASAIVTPTESGFTARMVARFRPKMPVYAVTPHDETRGWLTLVWGVESLHAPGLGGRVEGSGDSSYSVPCDPSEEALELLRQEGYIDDGALCVVTRGVPYGVPGTTNVMEIRTVGDVILRGSGVGHKAASGRVVVASNAHEALMKSSPGCILVVPSVNRDYVPALRRIASLIVEEGGLTSEGAIAAISLNIPGIVGASKATSVLRDGEVVTVDASRGVVYRGVAVIK